MHADARRNSFSLTNACVLHVTVGGEKNVGVFSLHLIKTRAQRARKILLSNDQITLGKIAFFACELYSWCIRSVASVPDASYTHNMNICTDLRSRVTPEVRTDTRSTLRVAHGPPGSP